MPQAAPESAKDLLSIIASYEAVGSMPESIVAQIRHTAEGMKNSAPVNAFIVLGVLECALGKVQTMRENFENALKQSDNSYVVSANYASCLAEMGFSEEAAQHIDEVLDRGTNDPLALRLLLNTAYSSFLYPQLMRIIDLYKKLKRPLPALYETIPMPPSTEEAKGIAYTEGPVAESVAIKRMFDLADKIRARA